MNLLRNLLAVVGGGAAGVAITALAWYGPTMFGVALAVAVACFTATSLIRHVDAQSREGYARQRQTVWERREFSARRGTP